MLGLSDFSLPNLQEQQGVSCGQVLSREHGVCVSARARDESDSNVAAANANERTIVDGVCDVWICMDVEAASL